MLRGGAFKPRTNPHSFQGLGLEGLEILAEIAPERELAIAREITKLHEETLRGCAPQLLQQMTGPRLKGELVLVLKGRGKPERRARREA